jgi:hypothetical protein
MPSDIRINTRNNMAHTCSSVRRVLSDSLLLCTSCGITPPPDNGGSSSLLPAQIYQCKFRSRWKLLLQPRTRVRCLTESSESLRRRCNLRIALVHSGATRPKTGLPITDACIILNAILKAARRTTPCLHTRNHAEEVKILY